MKPIKLVLLLCVIAVIVCSRMGGSVNPALAEAEVNALLEHLDKSSPSRKAETSDGERAVGAENEILAAQADELKQKLYLAQVEFKFYGTVLLIFAALASLYIVLRYITKSAHSPHDVVNASGLILITFGTIILVVIADAEEQLTAAIGILGAIAGYLFGSMRPRVAEERVSRGTE